MDGSDYYECLNPGIGVDKNLNLHVVYERRYTAPPPEQYRVFYVFRQFGETWSEPDYIDDSFIYLGWGQPTTPSIHVDYNWDIYATWRYYFDETYNGIAVRHKDDVHSNWQNIFEVPQTDDDSFYPNVSYGSIGANPFNTYIVWQDQKEDAIMVISGDYNYQTQQWDWEQTPTDISWISLLVSNSKPSVYQRSSEHYINVVWQAKTLTDQETSPLIGGDPAEPAIPHVCFREKDESGWLPIEIFNVNNYQDRNPVVTHWLEEREERVAIAYQDDDDVVNYLTSSSQGWYYETIENANNPALATLDNYPYIGYTAYNTPPYLINTEPLTVTGGMALSSLPDSLPHSRRVYFNLKKALSNGQILDLNADMMLQISDPFSSNGGNVKKVKPSYRKSLVNKKNAFVFRPINVIQVNSDLTIPVKIKAENIIRDSLHQSITMPLLKLRIKDAVNNQILDSLFTYKTNLLLNDSLDYLIIEDTFQVNLNAYMGRSILIEGKTFFNKANNVHIAEVYDVRQKAPQKFYATSSGKIASLTTPKQFVLFQNYPNPFNPETTISFNLSENSFVKLEIFDISGRKVRILVDQNMEAGSHQVVWDGHDDLGNQIASGVYFYRIQAGEFRAVNKMMLMR